MGVEAALRTVPRQAFIPDTIWVTGDQGRLVPLSRASDPRRWAEVVSSDDAVVTQVDDGAGDGVFPTSSSTAPGVMATMLESLGAGPGMRVLEIGTGTGWNAAVLAEIAGPWNVTTVEADPQIASHAAATLNAAGYGSVAAVCADGSGGYPQRAPYDRVIATCAVQQVPYGWVRQARPGARIVVPWAPAFTLAGALLVLTAGPGGTASGNFTASLGFMRMRGQRPGPLPWGEGSAAETTAATYPAEPFDDPASDAAFAAGAMLPGVSGGRATWGELFLADPASRSWASLTPGLDGHWVRQHGPRRLWDELDAACRWWASAGRPARERLGLTVTPRGQQLWLDHPGNVIGPRADVPPRPS